MKHGMAAVIAAALLCTGCMVQNNKTPNGGENVKVTTPFGGLHVRSGNGVTAADLGLPSYPGAVPVKNRDDDKSSGSADISMGFGDFKMKVKAVSFGTNDSADKVIAFYKKAMRQYGDVIECRKGKPVGKPEKTSAGLTCDDHNNSNANNVNFDEGTSLKAGSKHHQWIAAVDENGVDGMKTKFALVELLLPETASNGDNSN